MQDYIQFGGGYICVSERRVIGHDLVAVGQADHMLAGLDQPDDFTRNIHALKFERERIAFRDAVAGGKFIGQPEAFAGFFVRAPAHKRESRHGKVFRNIEGQRFFTVSL